MSVFRKLLLLCLSSLFNFSVCVVFSQSWQRIVCIFARLEEAIPFEALDDEPVDLIFLLLAPEHASGDHLKALARISRLLRAPQMLEQLRSTADPQTLYAMLTAKVEPHAA